MLFLIRTQGRTRPKPTQLYLYLQLDPFVSDPIRGVLGSPRNPPISNNIFKISHGGGSGGSLHAARVSHSITISLRTKSELLKCWQRMRDLNPKSEVSATCIVKKAYCNMNTSLLIAVDRRCHGDTAST